MTANTNGLSNPPYSLTALNRWSVAKKQLPPVNKIKALHVYDFDNTLFNSPLPNPELWVGPTMGLLQTQDTFLNGGWWHDSRILAATGAGAEKEELRGWEGWWNEKIVELIQLSMEQKDALAILLTGRSENGFTDLIKTMVTSKGLEFDLVTLKPAAGPNNQRFTSTMNFKQAFLQTLMETYREAEEIRIYEDRVRHVRGFRDFFMDYNMRQNNIGTRTRGPILAEVIQVADRATLLDPIEETSAVQRLINDHNSGASKKKASERYQIKKTVFYTGYLINNTDSQRLLTLAQLPPNMPDNEIKIHANNILITPRPCPKSILDKVGGMGSKVTWEVTGTAVFENKIWAACVQPVPENKKIYTENPVPIVVLALRKGVRPLEATNIQNWQPVPKEKQYVFETVVGEKSMLRVEQENPQENDYESLFPNKSFKRKHGPDSESSNRHSSGLHVMQAQSSRGGSHQPQNFAPRGAGRGNYRGNGGQRGYRVNSRGSGGGAGGGGRGRGRGGHNYRSLDDVGEKGSNGTTPTYNVEVAYEDFPPLQKQYQTPQQLVQQQFQNYQQFQQQVQGKGGNNSGGGGGGKQGNGELQYF